MTNEQILKKAIEKAVDNGFEPQTGKYDAVNDLDDMANYNDCFEIIFDHSFAKAFWGEEEILVQSVLDFAHGTGIKTPAWQYHLQVMVLEEEPLKYLAKFL